MGVTPVGNGERRPALGLILPATLQGELPDHVGATSGSTPTSAQALSELCRRAEEGGADSLWAVDHLFWPHPINECLTTLAIAAAATRRPLLGSCVLQLPLRQPAAVAKQASALQDLSQGRFILGLGVGSHPGEYAQVGVDFHQRGRLMDQGIAAMHSAWGSAQNAAGYRQQPASATVPLWIGGSSAAARRRAASVGDGWVPLFLTADEYGPDLALLRQEAAAAGRDPRCVESAVVVFVRVGPDDQAPKEGARWLSELYGVPPRAFERHLVAGRAEVCAAALDRYVRAGADHIVVMMAGDQAVQQFSSLRAAFVDRTETVLAGVPA